MADGECIMQKFIRQMLELDFNDRVSLEKRNL